MESGDAFIKIPKTVGNLCRHGRRYPDSEGGGQVAAIQVAYVAVAFQARLSEGRADPQHVQQVPIRVLTVQTLTIVIRAKLSNFCVRVSTEIQNSRDPP